MKMLKEQKWMLIVYGVILFGIGLTEFILSIVDFAQAPRVISYVVASGLILVGVLHIIFSLVKETKSFFKPELVLGSLAIAAGMVFIIKPDILGSFFIVLVAAFILVIGPLLIVKGIIGCVYKYKGLWIFLYFLLGTIAIVAGVLSFVYLDKTATVSKIIFCILSAIIIFVGIFLIAYGIRQLSKKNEAE